ncbi:hypothetical protein [Clostridium sp. JN-1]|jgi:PBP1b-binding outer membrane lipoprotein LpoB|uniref:hypothetical protein n=1 Tax=Clostridium sp. JN-1 TaxID=2483110 RepID=UPI000F0BC769|nr:hypothetical protein [Clostridium sp. JN-1]
MVKKFLPIVMTLSIAMNLIGCTTAKQGANQVKNKTENATEQTKNDIMKIPNDLQADMGQGTFFISTPSGTSQNGAVPIIYVEKNASVQQIGLTTSNFNGKNLSYVFVDSLLNSKHQLADGKVTMDLKGDNLKVGKHRVDIVQFNNNKTSDKVITHKTAYYEVKSK